MGEMGKVGVNFSSSGLAGMSKLRLAGRCTQVKGTAHGRLSRATEHPVPIGLGFGGRLGHSYMDDSAVEIAKAAMCCRRRHEFERSLKIFRQATHITYANFAPYRHVVPIRPQRNTFPTDLHELRHLLHFHMTVHHLHHLHYHGFHLLLLAQYFILNSRLRS